MEITPEDIENNQIHHCKDDFDDWCTVKNKSKSKRRARFKKKMESALEPIMENVSDDETYFSSSSEEEVQQQPQQKPIELVLKPQTFNSNRNEDNNNKKLMRALGDVFTNRNNLNNMETVRSPPEAEPPSQRSIIDKLHQTLDKVSSRYLSVSAPGVMFHDNSVLRCIKSFGFRYSNLFENCFISGFDTRTSQPMEQGGRLPRHRVLNV